MSLIDRLENEHQAFIVGTSFHVQFYETADGTRFVRQRSGGYKSEADSYASLADLVEATSGPISPGQLYAIVAAYHPLVTARVAEDRSPQRMSRSEARDFILREGKDIAPDDLRFESGTLYIKPRPERTGTAEPAPAPAAEVPPPPPPPQPRDVIAVVEVALTASGDLSDPEVKGRIEAEARRLLDFSASPGLVARRVDVVQVAALEEADALQPG